MRFSSVLKLCLSASLGLSALAQAASDDLKAFPLTESGLQRHVIRLPDVPDPESRKVELLVGKIIEVDCNRPRFTGQLQQKVVQGWGYTYYVLDKLAGPVSTLMACPPGAPREQKFVPAYLGEHSLIRYNPRLPLVVFAPVGSEVRYRIWTAGEEVTLP